MSLVLGLIVAYFCFLLATLVFKSRDVASPWLFLLRSFFPNWRFFHALGHAPRLYFRSSLEDEWTDWQRFMPRAKRHWSHLIHNPAVNLALTEQNLIDHLASDASESGDGTAISQCVTYRMVERLVREKLTPSDATQFQFRIALEHPASSGFQEDDTLLLSPCLDL